MNGERDTFLRLIGKRSAGDVADLLERSASDQVTLVAQALVALAAHLESARACPPIGSATEPLKPAACRSHKPELPRGDDLEDEDEIWHIAVKLCAIFRDAPGAAAVPAGWRYSKFFIDGARSLIEELDRYRSAPHGR